LRNEVSIFYSPYLKGNDSLYPDWVCLGLEFFIAKQSSNFKKNTAPKRWRFHAIWGGYKVTIFSRCIEGWWNDFRNRYECQQTRKRLKAKRVVGDFCSREFEGFPSTSGICATNTLLAKVVITNIFLLDKKTACELLMIFTLYRDNKFIFRQLKNTHTNPFKFHA